jgi:DNA-binding transcriptional regulator WhiA
MINRLTHSQTSEIRRLAESGASVKEIALALKMAKSTVYYHAKSLCRKMTAFDSSFLSECERGYVIGLFLGDGSFNKGRKEPRFFVRFALDSKRDRDIALRLVQILEKAGKKVSIFPSENTLIVKICSKELVIYIQNFIRYEQGEKRLILNKNWLSDFRYGVVAGIIDSNGHVHRHLGTEIKTVSKEVSKSVLKMFNDLGMVVSTRMREATRNSYSKKPRYVIYIPSSEIKRHRDNILSVKIARFP